MNYKECQKNMLKHETLLSKYATKDSDAVRLNKYTGDFRPNFYRDIDRIIHSLSYTRYIDKTQVFSSSDNDHISKRMIHVQLVSKIARTIGRALCLNEDLIEAIALAHDIGHVPFGHDGEFILNELSLKYNEGCFKHNAQSVRTLMNIENNGLGRNLTVQVLDGMLCHNGEFVNDKYFPKKKSKEDFLNDYQKCYTDKLYGKCLVPMTLEGCVVRISDIIGYLGRDIEDAMALGVLNKEQLPQEITEILGATNKDIVNTIILDIIEHSYNKPYIKMSDDVFKCIIALKKFNYNNIYYAAHTKEQLDSYKKMFEVLFKYYFKSIESKDTSSSIYQLFLINMSASYLKSTSAARKTIDYLAGMTDDFFINEYQKII